MRNLEKFILKSLFDTPEVNRKDYYKIFMANKRGEPKNDYPGIILSIEIKLFLQIIII